MNRQFIAALGGIHGPPSGRHSLARIGRRHEVLPFLDRNARLAQPFQRDVREQEIHLRPRQEQKGRLAVELAAIEAKNAPPTAAEDGSLLFHDRGLRVPDALGIHSLGGEESQVEVPKLEAFLGGLTEQSGLQVQELAGELENLNLRDGRQRFSHWEIRGHDRRGRDGMLPESLRDGENRSAGVEKIREPWRKQGVRDLGDLPLRLRPLSLPLSERRESIIKLMECATIGPGDLLFLNEGGQIAPGRRLGDAKAAAEFLNRKVAVLLEEERELLPPSPDHMQGDFHTAMLAGR